VSKLLIRRRRSTRIPDNWNPKPLRNDLYIIVISVYNAAVTLKKKTIGATSGLRFKPQPHTALLPLIASTAVALGLMLLFDKL
jgi:hypothetical protein